MNAAIYRLGVRGIRFVRNQCIQLQTLGFENLNGPGPFVIACSHLGNLEPFLFSSMVEPPIRWIARSEYYANLPFRGVLKVSGAISIHRHRPPQVQAIRTAIDYLNQGQIVGIFPEGGVTRADEAIFRGGVCRGGFATIAMRARVRIVPVLMIGTEKLNAVNPWLPGRRGRLWVAVGKPIETPPSTRVTRRAVRRALCGTLRHRFATLHATAITTFELDPSTIP